MKATQGHILDGGRGGMLQVLKWEIICHLARRRRLGVILPRRIFGGDCMVSVYGQQGAAAFSGSRSVS